MDFGAHARRQTARCKLRPPACCRARLSCSWLAGCNRERELAAMNLHEPTLLELSFVRFARPPTRSLAGSDLLGEPPAAIIFTPLWPAGQPASKPASKLGASERRNCHDKRQLASLGRSLPLLRANFGRRVRIIQFKFGASSLAPPTTARRRRPRRLERHKCACSSEWAAAAAAAAN